MSTADHTTCCCIETINDLISLDAAYEDAKSDRDEMAGRLTEAIDERDRARDTAARLEAELARGFRTAAPDITLSRTHDGVPGTPDVAVPGPSGALGRPGSEIRHADAYPHESGPESPDKPAGVSAPPSVPPGLDVAIRRALETHDEELAGQVRQFVPDWRPCRDRAEDARIAAGTVVEWLAALGMLAFTTATTPDTYGMTEDE